MVIVESNRSAIFLTGELRIGFGFGFGLGLLLKLNNCSISGVLPFLMRLSLRFQDGCT